jgi:DNA processing protein
MRLAFSTEGGPATAPISPLLELGAYEALWLEEGASVKKIADRFAADPQALPSDFVPSALAYQRAHEVIAKLKADGVHRFGVRIHHAGDYPEKLRDARHPIELLYYRGTWELAETRCVAVVGSRQASKDGLSRAARLARELVKRDFTVVSGLAMGIDTAAHTAALAAKGRTIAVVGTPIGQIYPKENRELQEEIATQFLLISQVPVLKHAEQKWFQNRNFFPERNVTMSALTEATIIVEAGDTSGTLTQARAALHQGRKLFILDSCFQRKNLTWPARFEKLGGIRVRDPDDIWSHLA